MKLNKDQFNFMYQLSDGIHNLDALHDGRNLGFMEWSDKTGELQNIRVNEDSRRQGVATSLWQKAHELADERGITRPVHARERTPEGDAWARAVGGEIPKRKSVRYQGHGRVGTGIDPREGESL